MGDQPAKWLMQSASRAINPLFWLATFGYVLLFSLQSLDLYHAYRPHAIDLGNMVQTAWNTAHGHPFVFQNQRLPLHFEAFGVTTRLGVHVEPIFVGIAAVYFLWQHAETLLVLQALVIAAGALPVRLLARRHLGRGLPELVFPLAYLLMPALEAANLDEFHPVALAAPLLLWAFYFADDRRYTLFTLFAIAAMGSKEEIGLLVAAIACLWIGLRNGDRRFALAVIVLSITWSVIAVKVIVPHFSGTDSSYWARYLPSNDQSAHQPVAQNDVLSFWLRHPGQVLVDLGSDAKLSYIQRLLSPLGYLSIADPVSLLAGIPSLLLVLLSYEPHMYSGVSHYSVELVPVVVVSAIFGSKHVCRLAVMKLRMSAAVAVTACCLYVLGSAVTNQTVNGFTALNRSFALPAVTDHDRLLDQVLASIPADASVSAQDPLNAHLSDRGRIYLYPDLDQNRVQYIALDVTQDSGVALRPCDLYRQVVGDPFPAPAAPLPCDTAVRSANSAAAARSADAAHAGAALLHTGRWSVQFARDGILLLKRGKPETVQQAALPAAFYTFVTPWATTPQHPVVARFGDGLELDGYSISRREATNLRNADVVVTTWWRVLKAPTEALSIMHYLTDSSGALQTFSSDQQSTDWLPVATWHEGQTVMVQSAQLTVETNHSGSIDVDIGVTPIPGAYRDTQANLQIHLVRAAGSTALVGVCRCHLLRLTHIEAVV